MQTNTHITLLWFLAAIILLTAAGPFPGAVTWLLVILMFLVLLSNWNTYSSYFQYPPGGSTNG